MGVAAVLRRVHLPRTWAIRIGILLIAIPLLIAFVGPFVAPYEPGEFAGLPFEPASRAFPMGTDGLGRDVFSRFLRGGYLIVIMGTLATIIGYAVGATFGLLCGYGRGLFDAATMRVMDVLIAFPGLLLVMLLATAAPGPKPVVIVFGIAFFHIPGVSRVIRAAALDTSVRGYVEAAEARGDSTRRIIFREILPNIAGTIAADGGPRLTISILFVTAFNFLGLGIQPPASDWGLLINEARQTMELLPWSIVVPAAMLAMMNVGTNILADAIARGLGHSIDEGLAHR